MFIYRLIPELFWRRRGVSPVYLYNLIYAVRKLNSLGAATIRRLTFSTKTKIAAKRITKADIGRALKLFLRM